MLCLLSGPDCAVRTEVALPVNDEERLCSVGSLQGLIQFGSSAVDITSGVRGLRVFSVGAFTAYIDTTACNGGATCIPVLFINYNDVATVTRVLSSTAITTFVSSPYDSPLTELVTQTGCVMTVDLQSNQQCASISAMFVFIGSS